MYHTEVKTIKWIQFWVKFCLPKPVTIPCHLTHYWKKFQKIFIILSKKLCKQTADYTDLVAFLFFSKSGICFISPNPLVGDSRARFETTKWSHFNEDVATFHKEVFNEMEPPYNNT